MADAIVVGGSISALAAAFALSGARNRDRVLERAVPPTEVPMERAVREWHRPTVPQAVNSHTPTWVGVRVLRRRAPQLLNGPSVAGALGSADRMRATALTDGLVRRSLTRVITGLSTPAAAFGDEKFLARVGQAPPIDPALPPPVPGRDEFVRIAAPRGA